MRFKLSMREEFQVNWDSDGMRSKSYNNCNKIQAQYEGEFQMNWNSDGMRSKSYSNNNKIQAQYEGGVSGELKFKRNAKQVIQQLRWG
jgi:hypothetical protein